MELIETLEFMVDDAVWVTERFGLDGVVYMENTHPKYDE